MSDIPLETTLSEIMSRDPFKCSDLIMAEIVKAFRDKRKQFNLGNLKAGSAKAPASKKSSVPDIGLELDL